MFGTMDVTGMTAAATPCGFMSDILALPQSVITPIRSIGDAIQAIGSMSDCVRHMTDSYTSCVRHMTDSYTSLARYMQDTTEESGYASRNRVERRKRSVFRRFVMKRLELLEYVDRGDRTEDEYEAQCGAISEARQLFYSWLAVRLCVQVNRDERRHDIDMHSEPQRQHDEYLKKALYSQHNAVIPRDTAICLFTARILAPRAPQYIPVSGPLHTGGCATGTSND